MVPSLLLALTVIIVMIDVLVGIHRGFQYSLVRLLVWIAGTFVAILISRSVTVFILLKLAKVPNMNLFAFDVFGSRLDSLTDSVGTHLTGLTVSFMVPVVFVGLFIITKFITWLIYIFIKKLIIKSAKKATAHNAAVDAVKAVESSEMPDIESAAMEEPVNLSGVSDAASDDPEFGTFGIYPKEEKPRPVFAESTEPGGADQMPVAPETESADVRKLAMTDPFLLAAKGELPEAEPEVAAFEPQVEEAEETEGFAALAESGDGFESLARASLMEEQREAEKEIRRNADKPKKVKVKKAAQPKRRRLKRKHSIAAFLIKKSVASSIFGGILGAVIAVYSCAIIASPVSQIVRIIADEKVAADAVDVISTAANEDLGELFDHAFDKREPKVDKLPKVFEISESFSLRPEDITEVFDTADDSVVHYIYKYTGADCLASTIYNSLTPVKTDEIDLAKKGVAEYNFPDSLRYYAKYIPQFRSLIETLHKGEGVSVGVLNKVESTLKLLFKSGDKGDVLSKQDKLQIANSMVDTLNETIVKQIGPYTVDVVLKHFDSYEEIDAGMTDVFNEMKRIVKLGFFERKYSAMEQAE
ncbi:MAG: CvpA family protein [Lachnospiraceae bacterium]|nr:CvpA family protein [Lachnospiraceae bacterium]